MEYLQKQPLPITATGDYTPIITDASKIILMDVAIDNEFTVPTNVSVPFIIGTEIYVCQYGVGQTSIKSAIGVTIRSAFSNQSLQYQYAVCKLTKIGTDEWVLQSEKRTQTTTTDPTINDDISKEYVIGSLWFNTSTNITWICLNNTLGSAVWKSSNYYQTIQDEGVAVPQQPILDFQGAGVNLTSSAGKTIVNIAGGQGTTTYYLNQSVTQAPYKEFSSNSTSAPEQTVSLSVPASTTSIISSFQTPSNIPNTTNIIGGLWSFFLHFTGTASDSWTVFVQVYTRTTLGVETLVLTTDSINTNTLSGIAQMIYTDGVFPTTSLSTTDRIVVKVNVKNNDLSPKTINFITEGSTNYSVSFTTLNISLPSGAVTSVTGTPPIASSGGTTPAISISQSSGSTDGYLSSTDWNTFNNKVSQAYTNVEDEGIALTQRSILNFVGTGVTASDVGGKTQITINTPTSTSDVWIPFFVGGLFATNQTIYSNWDAVSGVQVNTQTPFPACTIKAFKLNCSSNSANNAVTINVLSGAVVLFSVSIPASTTGIFTATGSSLIALNSLISIQVVIPAGGSSIGLRGGLLNYTI